MSGEGMISRMSQNEHLLFNFFSLLFSSLEVVVVIGGNLKKL